MIFFRINKYKTFKEWLIVYISDIFYVVEVIIFLLSLGKISSIMGDSVWIWLNKKLKPEDHVWPNS